MSKFLTRWLLMVALLVPWVTQAQQTLTVCDGTTTNSYVPMYGYYNDSRFHNEIVYPSNLLAGMTGSSITELTFYAQSDNSWNSNIELYIEEVDDTVYSSSYSNSWKHTSNAELVWNGTCSVVNGQWVITLSTPYLYNGGNLLFYIKNTAAGSGCPSSSFYGISTNYNASAYSTGTSPTTCTGQQFRPKVTFSYTSGGSFCLRPSNLQATAVGSDSISINWNTRNGESLWYVYLNNTYLTTVYDSSYCFTNLQPNTVYTIGVRAGCDNNDTSSEAALTLRTACSAITHDMLPWSEDLNSYTSGSGNIPSCFQTIGSTSYPYVYSYYHHGDQGNSLYFYPSSTATQFIVFPMMDWVNDLNLRFWVRSSSTTNVMRVGCMTDPTDSTTFVSYATLHPTVTNNWEELEANLISSNDSAHYVAIAVNGSYNSIYLDDFTLSEANSCPRPSEAHAYAIGTDEVWVRWTDTSETGSYTIEYIITDSLGSADADNLWMSDNTYEDSIQLSSLEPNTDYTVNIYSDCSGNLSDPRTITFHTACLPIAIDELPYIDSLESYSTSNNAIISPCWKAYRISNGVIDFSSSPYMSTSYAQSGSKSIYMGGYNNATSASYLVFQQTEEDVENLAFRCYVRTGYSSSTTANFSIGLMSDPLNPASFIAIKTINNLTNTYQEVETGFSYHGDTNYIAIRFYDASGSAYIDDIVITYAAQCPRVDDVTVNGIGGTSATIAWTDLADRGDYLVEYFAVNDSDNVYTETVFDTTAVEITDLLPQTDYSVTVYANCDNEQGEGRTINFQTGCTEVATTDLPYTFHFDSINSLAPCWSLLHHGYSWSSTSSYLPQLNTSESHSPNKSLRMNSLFYFDYDYYENEEELTMAFMPVFESPLNTLSMTFWYKINSSNVGNVRLAVGVSSSTSDSSTFTRLATINPTDGNWHEYDVDLSSYNGNGRHITFMQYSVDGDDYYDQYGYIDDITISSLGDCARPSSVSITNVTSTSAEVNWVDADDQTGTYRVKWTDNDSTVVTGSTSYTLNGLTPNTDYTVSVSKLCNGEYTQYRTASFRTACVEIANSSLPWSEDFETYASNANTIPCWTIINPYVTSYGSQYPYVNGSNSNNHTANGSKSLLIYHANARQIVALPLFEDDLEDLIMTFYAKGSSANSIEVGVINDLSNADSFQLVTTIPVTSTHQLNEVTFAGYTNGYIAFRSVGTSSVYIDDIVVDELPSCTTPSNVVISNITATSADITINDASNAGSYVIYWSASDSVVVNSINYTLNGLSPATSYTISVKGICSDGTRTNSRSVSFTTPCVAITDLPWTEDFESYTSGYSSGTFPNCWTRNLQVISGSPSNISSYIYITSDHHVSGSNSLEMIAYNNSLVTKPVVVLPQFARSIDSLTINFNIRFTSGKHYMEVGYITNPDDLNTFVPLDTIKSDTIGTLAWYEYEHIFADATQASGNIALRYTYYTANDYYYAYIDDVVVSATTNCSRPQSVNVTASEYTANVTINDLNNTNNYRLIVDNGTTADTLYWTSATGTLNNLTPGTDYTMMVSAICADGSVTNATNVHFSTLCVMLTHNDLPVVMDFENYPTSVQFNDPCWNTINYDSYYTDYPRVSTSYHHGNGSNSGYFYLSNATSSQWLVSPAIDSVNDLQMNFWLYGSASMKVTVGTLSNPADTTTFVPIQTFTPSTAWTWEEKEVLLNSASDTVNFVALRVAANSTYVSAYLDDITINQVTQCVRPQGVTVSNVTATTADITIADSTNNNYYRVEYATDGTTLSDTLYATTGQISGLTPGSVYSLAVYSICNDGNLTNPENTSFQTSCVELTHADLPYTENFDSYEGGSSSNPNLSPCWRILSSYSYGNSYVYNYANYSHSTPNSMYCNAGGPTEPTYIILPTFDSVSDLMVSFWMRHYYYTNPTVTLVVGAMSDPSDVNTFVPVETLAYTEPSNTYQNFEVSMINGTFTTTPKCIALKVSGVNYSTTSYFDDFTITLAPSCSKPIDLTVSNITTTTATLSFTDNTNAGHYKVAIDGDTTDIYNTTYQMTGLEAATNYTVSVASVCSDGTVTSYVSTDFNTLVCDGVTAQIGDDSLGVSSSYYIPLYANYRYTISEMIIDSVEIGGPMDITNISFTVVGNTPLTYADSVRIYLQPTTKSSFSGSSDYVNLDSTAKLVYTGSLNGNVGINYYTFDSVYSYNGQGNLLLVVVRNEGEFTSDYAKFRTISTGNVYKTLYYYNDNTACDPTDWGSLSSYSIYTNNYRPDIQLISCGAGCPAPTALSASDVDYQGATLNWSSSAASFEVAVKAASEAVWPAETAVNSTSYTVSGLTPATTYQFRVRALCEDDMVSDWTTFSFTTDSLPCFAPSALQVESEGMNSVTLDWSGNGNETTWRVHVWNTNFDQTYDVTTHPATVTGLAKNTQYNAAVMALCGGILESEASDTVTFTTLDCPVPTNVAVSGVTTHTATINWNGTAASYTLEYGSEGYPQGDGTTIANVTGNSYELTGLIDGYAYDVYVMANCDAQNSSDWSAKATFTTLVGIDGVQGSMLTLYPNPTSNSTTITLSGVNGDVTIAIVDMNGRTVLSESMNCEGDCTKTMQVNDLAQGAYFVRINGENVNMVKKLIVK